MTEEIKFVDELPPTGYSTRWADVAEALKQRPGKWALVAAGVNPGFRQSLQRRGIETTSRNTTRDADGKHVCDIYARWPESDDEATS